MKDTNKKQPSLFGDVMFLLAKISFIVLTFVIIFTWIYGAFRNDEYGMTPAINQGDLIIYYRLDKNYLSNDVIAIKENGVNQTRRVIATEGDTVDIKENGLYVNGYLQTESKIYFDTKRFEEGIDFPVTIGPGEVFVLGDNREKARDSRLYGPISVDDTLGKVMMVFRIRDI